MKRRDDLIIRLLQESSSNVKVLIRTRDGHILPLESVREIRVLVTSLQLHLLPDRRTSLQ